MPTIRGLSGSLRRGSFNTELLREGQLLVSRAAGLFNAGTSWRGDGPARASISPGKAGPPGPAPRIISRAGAEDEGGKGRRAKGQIAPGDEPVAVLVGVGELGIGDGHHAPAKGAALSCGGVVPVLSRLRVRRRAEMTAITKEDGGRHGRYVAWIDGIEAEGEITFTHRGPGIISADHTGVPDAMAGQGVARALLDFMLDDARREGFRIIPVCPFVRAQYARHPEWADLFTTRPGEDP